MNNTKAKQEAERVTTRNVNVPPEDLVAFIIARPGNYDACLLGLAQAYEAQRERIDDLEDDVERLRPREPFVPDRIFDLSVEGHALEIFTECKGGLTVDVVNSEGGLETLILDKDQSHQLATALAKWAGLSVIDQPTHWAPLPKPPTQP